MTYSEDKRDFEQVIKDWMELNKKQINNYQDSSTCVPYNHCGCPRHCPCCGRPYNYYHYYDILTVY